MIQTAIPEESEDPIYGHEQLGDHLDDDGNPINVYREVALKSAEYMDRLFAFLIESKSVRVAVWAAAYATDSSHCEGVSESDRAAQLKISTQGLSKEIKRFQRVAGMEPSNYMYKKAK